MADGNHLPDRWLSTAELAGLPGLPGTERGVRKMAERDGWPSRRKDHGKGLLYPVNALPAPTRARIATWAANDTAITPEYQAGASLARRLSIGEAVDAKVAQRNREQGATTAAGLAGAAKARMDAKLEVLARLNAFAQTLKVGQCAALDAFAEAYNTGAIDVAAEVRTHAGETLTAVTLRRWKKAVKTQGPAALAGAYGNRKGDGKLDTDASMREFVIGFIADKPHASAKLLHDALETRYSTVPSESNVRRWLNRWKKDNAEAYLALTNPDAWKNRNMAAFGSASEGITRACQLWMMDSTPADLQLIDGRYNIIGVIDIAWRGLRLYVSKTSSAEAVSQLTRRTILEWGVPEAIKMDNGSDYASQRFARLLTGLQIEAKFSAPFSPWEKPHIERAFHTFSHSLLELLPGYTGHNVAEAQAIRARKSFAERLFKKNEVVELKLTAAELQEFCDRWCRDYYAHEAHKGLEGQTPFQRYAQLRDVVPRIGDVRALDLLLGEGRMCHVTKKGIRMDKLNYIAPELATVIGQDVLVRPDDADIGRAVVYAGEQFLCIAECPEVAGVSRREIAIEAKARQTKAVQEAKKTMRDAKRKANTGDIAREILEHKAAKNAALSTLPAPNVVHITPALEAASVAADALDREARAEQALRDFDAGLRSHPGLEPETEAERQAVQFHYNDAFNEMQLRELSAEDAAKARFVAALDLMLIPEQDLNDLQRRQLKNYSTSAEFLGRYNLFEYFGPSGMGLDEKYAVLLLEGTERDRLIQAHHNQGINL